MGRPLDRVMNYFQQISRIPRCSKQEAQVSAWIRQWADDNGYRWQADAAGNLVIQVPGRGGGETSAPVILQGHMDMVCEKTPDSPHDFSKDPLTLITQGEWLHADRTTLGADNGIALALAMAAATDETNVHPPLELLFTVDEETGLTGAEKLETDMLTGKVMINIDSEDEGTFTVGCAGGQHVDIHLTLSTDAVATSEEVWDVTVGGLHGGHSGVDIHRNRANANLVLAQTLKAIRADIPMRLVAFEGGSAHNAIARDARAVIATPLGKAGLLGQTVAACEALWQKHYASTDGDLFAKLGTPTDAAAARALSVTNTDTVLALILALPHGVAGLSAVWRGVVETSANLARVDLREDRLSLLCSLRSSDMGRLDEITTRVNAIAELAGAQASATKRYPAWEVDLESDLLARCRRIYADLFAREARVEVMHAGLECGVIGAKYPGMEMISIGPTLEHPHSPQERLNLPSVERVWSFMAALLRAYAA
ncbi:MAG: beta-Ala-His dipeptidase [Desulfosarcinaceae bacterium]|nr:beta-Ala-His dipeptidase [Desulfosarcinaceae bacterium]